MDSNLTLMLFQILKSEVCSLAKFDSDACDSIVVYANICIEAKSWSLNLKQAQFSGLWTNEILHRHCAWMQPP